MNTTRCYPRTAAQAFKDATYACAIEYPPLSLWKRIVRHIVEMLS